MAIIAKIGIIGDTHASDSGYGGHNDYPAESLENFCKISELTEQLGLTHLIGSGDLTFKRFTKLEYRDKFETELEKQNKLTNGNRYEIFGNHDSATNGMTEYEYYVKRGLLKRSTKLNIGNLHISMLDYRKNGLYTEEDMNIVNQVGHTNVAIAHQYFKFNSTRLPNFGDAVIMDNYEALFGLDKLICGHIHHIINFDGEISSGEHKKKCCVQYLGCPNRPSYREGFMDEVGIMEVISVHDTGEVTFETVEFPLWSLDKSFNLIEHEEKQEKKAEKEARVDISDIVKQLDSHNRNVGNPEDIIRSMQGIDDKYKNKAIELLHSAL